MKFASVQLKFGAEKLQALRSQMKKKNVDLETELTENLEKMYEKHVPQILREYIEELAGEEKPLPKPKSVPATPATPHPNDTPRTAADTRPTHQPPSKTSD